MAQYPTTKNPCDGPRDVTTMAHNVTDPGIRRDVEMSQLARHTVESPPRPNVRFASTIHRSQASYSSIDSTLTTFKEPTKSRRPESALSLNSTTFGSSPSLVFDFVRSTETLNYDETERRVSVPVIPACETMKEKYADNIATPKHLEALTSSHPLPELASGAWNERWRQFRYGTMSAYMRLWALAIAINVAVIIAMICRVASNPASFTYGDAATATGANLLVAALMRHEHCVNLLFRLATALPHRTPLAIRRHAAKVYSYGGVHSGCGISALLWYIFYTGLAIVQFKGTQAESVALAATTALALLCLLVIIGMAHPQIRIRWHDQWEVSHRFAGWTAIALVWAQTLVVTIAAAHHSNQSVGVSLVHTPTFWFLVVITCCLIYPWLRMRRRKVNAEVLSSHAVRLWFDNKEMKSCVGARLSHHPLTENHGFATIPNARPRPQDEESGLAVPAKAHTRCSSTSTTSSSNASSTPSRGKGHSILVSRAGDFTSDLISNPPTHIYTRGAPTRGVLHVAHLFKPIILIATGSGIGPCLSFLQAYPDYPVRVLWSARSPQKTYGDEIMDAVLRADGRAVVIDTQKVKKPDLVWIAWGMAKEEEAEAVAIISNPFTTRKLVFALESRGFPAFGAIFDS